MHVVRQIELITHHGKYDANHVKRLSQYEMVSTSETVAEKLLGISAAKNRFIAS